uniref:Uncharacterized protein n=1 Tax=Grammatophora oceanica TaxID=210454 RepID=A0A7S1V5F5_9STRA|mmetsp:Transcript_37101/g.55263  ORF Transcript_37101/g.55263 Transcript_37101/m.55263 type:complete len:122 (+) Transcript_37101:109-474(+)|eukprot:CAMPEP_0194027610 /NCGR_PEP_ID=MMETSP0009_2-20130614/1746_1 /TAXON_ID=210454 /ORGANISM="Grammatophora oceanica, Strain CCMP 410" /LENGTH=121 /DNA_ID=CAMNT_0038666745 /DNA_START=97 /DNA_END=462 /DNA_ORIENTATION=-
MRAQSFNVARRHSNRNEPDLLQESFLRGDSEPHENHFSLSFCSSLVNKIKLTGDELPLECTQAHPQLKRHLSPPQHDMAVAFQGMSAGEASAAMSRREKNQPTHAQIQRRLTASRRFKGKI